MTVGQPFFCCQLDRARKTRNKAFGQKRRNRLLRSKITGDIVTLRIRHSQQILLHADFRHFFKIRFGNLNVL